jgi:16S rRNA (guanine527-N7)-methyltransferase
MSILQEYLARGAEELGIVLDQGNLEKFAIFAAELCKWNRKINLTTITREEDIAVKHFLDSLVIVKYVNLYGALLDIGSGGGFPAIPLKIVAPAAGIVSVDAIEKKILFQRHIARLLCFDGFDAIHARVEALVTVYPKRFDSIVSRAFSDIAKFVQVALPLLAPDGVIVAMKGREGKNEVEISADKLAALGVVVTDINEFTLPLIRESRSLVIIRRGNP